MLRRAVYRSVVRARTIVNYGRRFKSYYTEVCQPLTLTEVVETHDHTFKKDNQIPIINYYTKRVQSFGSTIKSIPENYTLKDLNKQMKECATIMKKYGWNDVHDALMAYVKITKTKRMMNLKTDLTFMNDYVRVKNDFRKVFNNRLINICELSYFQEMESVVINKKIALFEEKIESMIYGR